MSVATIKIRSFLDLPPGWHFGSGVPPTPRMVGRASAMADFVAMLEFSPINAFPGIDGEVMVTGLLNAYSAEITLELDGTFRLAVSDENEEIQYDESLTIAAIVTALTKTSETAKALRCALPESYIPNTGILIGGNLSISPFGRREILHHNSKRFPAFPSRVQRDATEGSVNIAEHFIETSHPNPQSFGFSMNQVLAEPLAA